jgi:hypothetical protein
MPSDSSSGYTLTTMSDGKTRDGSVLRFMARVFAEYQIQWVVQPISNASLSKFPGSSFTACVFEVGLNETDICIGSFISPHRMRVLPHRAICSS